MSTYVPKGGDVDRKWYVIDATDVVLGRLATQAAKLLRGKHKPTYTPNVDGGDFVVIINADKVAVSANKREQVKLYRHSGFPGGLRTDVLGDMLKSNAPYVVETAVKGMLPHNRLSSNMIGRLKIYAGSEHPHAAQQPVPYDMKQVAQ